jgi:hypothetical protein
MKSGVPNWAATAITGEWQHGLVADLTDLDKGIAEIKASNLAKHYEMWHVPWLGHINLKQPDEVFCILGSQFNSASPPEICTGKVKDVLRLINNWEVQAGCLSEVGVNWNTYPLLAKLASWIRDDLPDIHTHTAHNTHEKIHIMNQVGLQLSFAGNWPSTQSNVLPTAEALAIGAQPCSMLTQITDSD